MPPAMHDAATLAEEYYRRQEARASLGEDRRERNTSAHAPANARLDAVVDGALDQQSAALEGDATSYATAHMERWLSQAQERADFAEQGVKALVQAADERAGTLAAVQLQLEATRAAEQHAHQEAVRLSTALKSAEAESSSLRSTCSMLARCESLNPSHRLSALAASQLLGDGAAAPGAVAAGAASPEAVAAGAGAAAQGRKGGEGARVTFAPHPPSGAAACPSAEPASAPVGTTASAAPLAGDAGLRREADAVLMGVAQLQTSLEMSAALIGSFDGNLGDALGGQEGGEASVASELIDELRTHLIDMASTSDSPTANTPTKLSRWHQRAAGGWSSAAALQTATLMPGVSARLDELSGELAACRALCARQEAALKKNRLREASSRFFRARMLMLYRCMGGWRVAARESALSRLAESERASRLEAVDAHALELRMRVRAEAEANALRRAAVDLLNRPNAGHDGDEATPGVADGAAGADGVAARAAAEAAAAAMATRHAIGSMPAWRASTSPAAPGSSGSLRRLLESVKSGGGARTPSTGASASSRGTGSAQGHGSAAGRPSTGRLLGAGRSPGDVDAAPVRFKRVSLSPPAS